MADRDKVDELVIELNARDKATQKIDNLAKSLRGLGDSLTVGLSSAKMNSVASSLKNISSATQELGRSTRAINNLPKLTTELSNMMNTLHDAPSISKDVLSLAHALSKIDGSAIKGFSNITSPKINTEQASEGMKAIESEERKVDSQTKEVTQSMNNFGNVVRKAFANIPSLLGNLKKINFSGIANQLNSILGKVGNLGKKLLGLYKNVSLIHRLSNISLKKGFTTLLRYTVGIRSIFVLTNKIRSAIEDGNKNLAQYSDTFNKSMSLYKSGLGTMKNALSVAFAPLVNYFSSAVNKIIDSFIDAFNTIARLMARLTGAKQVVQATRYYNDFADSLGSASKNAKDLTTGIDELNILNDTSSSSSGGTSTDVQDMFETVDVGTEFDDWINSLKDMWDKADFYDLGQALADKINQALQNIDWETIKANAGKIGKSLATFLNGVFEEELNGVTLGYEIGKTIGEAINTGIEFAYAFVTEFHWDSFGQFIADGIKGALETIEWAKLGETLHRLVNGLLETLTTLFSDEQLWIDLGQSIGEFFSGIEWKETWFNFKNMVSALVGGIKTALKEWQEEDPESFNIAITIGIAIAGIKLVSMGGKIAWGLLGTSITNKIGEAIVGSVTANGVGATLQGVGSVLLPFGITLAVSILAVKFANWLQTKNEFGHTSFKKITDLFKFNKEGVNWNGDKVTYTVTLTTKIKNLQFDFQEWVEKVHKSWKETTDAFKENDLFGEIKKSYDENFSSIKEDWGTAIDNLKSKFEWLGDIFGSTTDKNDAFNKSATKSVSILGDQSTWVQTASTSLSDTYCGALEDSTEKTTTFSDTVKQAWEDIKENASTKLSELKENVSTSWQEYIENSATNWEEHKENLSTAWEEIKTNAGETFQNVKDSISTKWEETKTKTSTKWTEIKNNLSTTWTNLKKDATDKFNEMKENVTKSFNTLKENIKRPINAIIDFVEKMANAVVDAVNKIIETVNSMGSIDIPGIGTIGIAIPPLGYVHIPRLADGGFVPNTNMGSLFWAGENGAEIVAHASGGTEVLNTSQVASAVANGIREVVVDSVIPYLNDLVNTNQAIADKDMSVNIGDREIAEANRRGESSLGLQLVTV